LEENKIISVMSSTRHKDLFSTQANVYAAFRPTYPKELYDFIFDRVETKRKAWDCATGNGQVAGYLANHFDSVYATDISQQQLDNAIKKDNVIYSISGAEKTSFEDQQFDLITVAQALHWLDRERFTTKQNGWERMVRCWPFGDTLYCTSS
jgi:2-polyprenyl-3-methyl-5-hydroxy-6-metoxy-1,4-benzoquinol methylase